MAMITKEITVDVARTSVFQTIVAKQNDSNSRFLKVTITNEGNPLPIESASTVVLDGQREDGETKAFIGMVNSDGTVTVPLSKWLLELNGMVKCDITIVDSESRKLSTVLFYLAVEESIYDDTDITEDENFDLLVQLLAEVAKTKAGLDEITAAANSAALNANAMATYANTAGGAAQEAADRANNASVALTALAENAVNEANEATERATAAAESAETESSNLAQLKEDSETATENATNAANLANEKASLADTKAEEANTAAALANEKATLADEKATLANEKAALADTNATKANEATERATAAAESAETATNNAGTATSDAVNAANLASQKAAEAESAAESANDAADNANTKADLAQEKADLAEQKANLAETNAQTAIESSQRAETATENANAATDAANSATTSANDAATSANEAADAANEAASRVTEPLQAVNISYDNTDSGLDAENVKGAIDELTLKLGGVAGLSTDSWENIQQIVRLGLAPKVFSIGDQFTVTKGSTSLVFDIIGFDHDTPVDTEYKHSMTLQLHDCYNNFQFDAPEALYYCESELPSGTYYFTIHNYDATYGGNKSYSFTLVNAVPAGGQIDFRWGYNVQASTCKISTYENSESTTAIETVSVTEGTEGTYLGTTDGKSENMNHAHRIRYGSNRWGQSAIKQWLNTDAEGNTWWTPTNIYDRPSGGRATAGFLNGLDADFLSILGKVNKRTAKNTVTDGGGYEDSEELMFLISRSEVYSGLENSVNEGQPYAYYKDFSDYTSPSASADSNRIKYLNGSARYWWLRTPFSGDANSVRGVFTTGNIYYDHASSSLGVAPACCII